MNLLLDYLKLMRNCVSLWKLAKDTMCYVLLDERMLPRTVRFKFLSATSLIWLLVGEMILRDVDMSGQKLEVVSVLSLQMYTFQF